jgi:hypothetical protein
MGHVRAVAGIIGASMVAAAIGIVGGASAVEASTVITMRVTGCEGCTITPVQAISGQADIWTGTPTKVRGGQAQLTVPTSRTAGMSFNLDATWPVDINAMPVIVTQYQGFAPGQRVSVAQAKAAKRATACWAGTSQPSVTLSVRVGRVMMAGFPAGRAKVPLAYLVPTAETTGGFSDTVKGVLAQQEAWWCPGA